MAKQHIRSIRFSDELADLIEQQSGNTFTQKFENLITRCIWELPKHEMEIERLNLQISKKREQIIELQRQISSLGNTTREISTRLKVLEDVISRELKQWETED